MKKSLSFLMAGLVVLLSSCVFKFNVDTIKPSKNIVKKEYRQEAFDKIDVHAVAHVHLVQSNGDSRVILSAPENYVELFSFKNKDGELDIDFAKDKVNIESKNVHIIVYTPNLRSIENSGVGRITTDSLKAYELEIENSGVGTLQLSGLRVNKLETECSGVGNIELNGLAAKAKFECSGVGNIKARDLKARYVKAEVTGVGGIECYATEYIKGNVAGIGSLKYAGNPGKKHLNHPVTGSISEL
jgi:hypothetical protein